MEIAHRPFVDDQHRLTVTLFLLLLVSQLALLDLNIILLCQPAQGFRVSNLLVLHQEVDSRTTFPTGKALTNLFRRRHHKRGGLIVVERTQSLIVHAGLAESHKLPYHVHDVRGIHDLIYRRSVNHRLFLFQVFGQGGVNGTKGSGNTTCIHLSTEFGGVCMVVVEILGSTRLALLLTG